MGYIAFGDATLDIITLNLPHNWSTAAVKLMLCVGLYLTFPIMLIPVYEIVERGLVKQVKYRRWLPDVISHFKQDAAGPG